MMLKVEGLQKTFSGFRAVNGANLEVATNEIVAVIGPNGAGKTTLFNLITGILKPDGGRVTFCDEDITGLPAYKTCRKGITRSFQVVNIFPALTVFENVQIAVLAEQHKTMKLFTPSKRTCIKETLEIVGNVGLADKKNEYLRGPLPRRPEGARNRHRLGRQTQAPHPRRADCGHVAGRDRTLHRPHQEAQR